MKPEVEGGSEAGLEAAESQQRQADNFAWTVVPVVAIAGQAFMFQIALAEGASAQSRIFVAVAGLVILGAAAHLMLKQVFNFDMYEAVAERERIRLGHPRMTRDYLLADFDLIPEDTSLRRREWWWEVPIRRDGTRHRAQAKAVRMVVKRKALHVWLVALGLLALLDLGILIAAIWDCVS